MKKIVVEKHEGIAEVIDRMIAAADEHIIFVIPKGAALGKSAGNFRLLKREAGLAEKNIAVESTDEDICSLAEANGILLARDIKQPKAKNHSGQAVSDIVAKSTGDRNGNNEENEKEERGVRLPVHAETDDDEDDADRDGVDDGTNEALEKEKKESFFGADRFFKPRQIPSTSEDRGGDDEGGRGMSGKAVAWTIGILVVLGAIFYGVTIVFGRAQITIDFTQTPWNYSDSYIADKAVSTSTLSPGANTIPAQIFTTSKNITNYSRQPAAARRSP